MNTILEPTKSLYERIGGEGAVSAAVEKLYDKVMDDPLLAPLFSYDRLGMLKHHQIALMTAAFGGPDKYTGRRLREVHLPMMEEHDVGDEHFDAVMRHIADAMQELHVPPDLIREALAIVESTRADVLNR